MLTRRLFATCALCAISELVATGVEAQPAPSATGGVKRVMLQQTDGPIDGYVTILARGEIEPGATVARHTHPGIETAYVLMGEGELSVKGEPNRPLRPGESFQVTAYVPHAIQNGNAPMQIASTYVVEKGKPLASLAPE